MRRWILILLLIAAVIWGGWVLIQRHREQQWSNAWDQASAAVQTRRFSDAQNLLLGILPDTRRWWPHSSRLADTFKLLGTSYLQDRKFDDAMSYHREAIQTYENFLPPNAVEIARIETTLARLYRDQGQSAEAERYFSESLGKFERNPSYSGVEIAWDLHNLGAYRTSRGEFGQAEALLKRCIAAYEAAGQTAPKPDVADAHFHLAEVFRKESKNDQAETEFRKSLELEQAARGPNSPQVAYALNGLALVYQDEGRINNDKAKNAEAKELLQRAKAIEQASTESRKADGVTLNNLGLTAVEAGKYSEAQALFRKAISEIEETQGPEALVLAAPLDNLGRLYRDQEQFDLNAAEPLLKRALSIREKALGPDHPDTAITLSNLSLLSFYQHKPQSAEQFAARALPTQEKTYGADSLEVSTTLNRLGLAQRDQRKFSEAERSLQQALSIREKKLTPNHEWIAISLDNLASVYLAEGKANLAKPLVLRAQGIRNTHPRS
jgi:tetratricopeptide (TPR) repeat protein